MKERSDPRGDPFTMATLAAGLGVAGLLVTALWCAAVYLIGDRVNGALLLLAWFVDLLALVFGLLVIGVSSGRAWVGVKRGIVALLPTVALVFSPLLVAAAALLLQPSA